jgi:hypothetical protein
MSVCGQHCIYNPSGNDAEQTANTCNINACNRALIKISKPILKQLKLALIKYLLLIIIDNRVIIFDML